MSFLWVSVFSIAVGIVPPVSNKCTGKRKSTKIGILAMIAIGYLSTTPLPRYLRAARLCDFHVNSLSTTSVKDTPYSVAIDRHSNVGAYETMHIIRVHVEYGHQSHHHDWHMLHSGWQRQ